MKKSLAVAALTGLVVLTAGTPAFAAKTDAAQNKPAYWEAAGYGTCSKVDLTDGTRTWTLAEGSTTLLVLKAGSGAAANTVIELPAAGVAYGHSTGKDLSHVITCVGDGSGGGPIQNT